MGQQDALTAPAQATVIGIEGPVLHTVLLVVALVVFVYIMWRRVVVLRRAAPDPRLDRIGRRLLTALVVGFGQSRQPRYAVAGTLHILIFFGFLILSVRSLTLLGQGFVSDFGLPGFDGQAYASLKDVTALLVLAACVLAMFRRLVVRPSRYHDRHAVRGHGLEAYTILGLIALLMVADAFFEGSVAAGAENQPTVMPLASIAAWTIAHCEPQKLASIHLWSFWIHNVALLFFLCYLPVSKHFHVITAIPNVFLSKLTPGTVKPPRHDQPDLDHIDRLGAGQLEDFTWKHILDFYSCTDCGRCSDHCPAYATGTPLSPRMISVKARDHAYASFPLLGRVRSQEERQALVGDVIRDDELWACTTCAACEEACPVLIEYVDKIVDMRRFLVDEGRLPPSLRKPLEDLEKRGNPYGKPARQRADWVKSREDSCGVRILENGDSTDVLFFTDSCAAYDPRIQDISRALGRILRAAGVDCATMGADEVDSGHEVRRFGEEGLFESLRDRNLEALQQRDFRRIVTTDPHAFNALRNDGYDLGRPVLHHTQLIAELLDAGDLKLRRNGDYRTHTFHDPCYLGRHNGEYDAPRRILEALPNIHTVEMNRSRNRSFCCGGGSLYLFHEGPAETRMGEMRVRMAEEAGAHVIVTACPFCMINLEDAVKTSGEEGVVEVVDIAELVSHHLTN